MTLGERLLDLTVEYHTSTDTRNVEYQHMPGTPTGRDPKDIAVEYEAALRELLT